MSTTSKPRQVIGSVMLVMPFVVLFVAVWRYMSLKVALLDFGLTAGIIVYLYVAIAVADGGRDE